jgi:hypothetical protein
MAGRELERVGADRMLEALEKVRESESAEERLVDAWCDCCDFAAQWVTIPLRVGQMS